MSAFERIEALSAKDARSEWRRAFATEPPIGFNTDLIRRAIANEIQRDKKTSLSKRHARELTARVQAYRSGSNDLVHIPKTGTRLSRVWHGVTHNVIVLPNDGFDYRGQRYGSLSAIAREITGTAWSGPRFFGLTSKCKRDA